jgi:hypothetical protein
MVQPTQPYSRLKNYTENMTITISTDDQNSNSFDMQGSKLRALIMPSVLTSNKFQLQFSIDNSFWYNFTNITGVTQDIQHTADGLVFLNDFDFLSDGYLRVRTNSSELADRTFIGIFG